jgi:hypothetical protein
MNNTQIIKIQTFIVKDLDLIIVKLKMKNSVKKKNFSEDKKFIKMQLTGVKKNFFEDIDIVI